MAARKKTDSAKKDGAEAISYREASTELESILGELEDGTVDVDVLTERVERAANLIRVCRDKLAGTEMRVTKVVEELSELAKSKAPAPDAPTTTADKDGDDDGEAESADGLPF